MSLESDGGCGLAVKAPDCGSGYRGFESRQPPFRYTSKLPRLKCTEPAWILGIGVSDLGVLHIIDPLQPHARSCDLTAEPTLFTAR